MFTRSESNRQVKSPIVQSEADKLDLWPVVDRELIEIGNGKSPRQLARAVRTKVEKDHGVAVTNGCYRFPAGHNDRYWLNKLVGDSPVIGAFDCLNGTSGLLAHCVD